MNVKFWSNHRFDDPVQLLEALKQGDSGAIIFFQNKARSSTRKLLQQYRLPEHLLPEVLNDASVIFIKKLREPDFTLHSAKPLTYFIEIIKKVVSNETRKRQIGRHEPIENQYDLSDSSIDDYHARKETIELLNSLLSGAGASCEQVIRLKYLDGFSDEEAIQQRLTSYSTVESLRQKRSDCMKKLKERVASQKNNKN